MHAALASAPVRCTGFRPEPATAAASAGRGRAHGAVDAYLPPPPPPQEAATRATSRRADRRRTAGDLRSQALTRAVSSLHQRKEVVPLKPSSRTLEVVGR